MFKSIKSLVLVMTVVFGSTTTVCAQNVGIKYSDDSLGEEFVEDLTAQLKAIKNQVALLEQTITDRKNAINYILSENSYRLFVVKKGSFKEQLVHFADRLKIKTIRWSDVPECIDWDLDATYDIELEDAEQAIDDFLDGMPLTYQYFPHDNSLNLTSTTIIQGCPNE